MRIEKILGKFGPARGRGKCSPLPFSLAPYLPAAEATENEVRTGLETSVVLKLTDLHNNYIYLISGAYASAELNLLDLAIDWCAQGLMVSFSNLHASMICK